METVVEDIYNKKKRAKDHQGEFSVSEYEKFIARQRGIIDNCNELILDAFAKRVEASKRVAIAKMISESPVYSPKREEEILAHAENYAKKINLDPKSAREVIEIVLKKAREQQDEYYLSL